MARGGRKKKRKERKKRGKKREKRGRIGCAVVVASSIFGLWPVDRTDRFFISPKERGGQGGEEGQAASTGCVDFLPVFFLPPFPLFFFLFSLCPPLCLSPFPPSRSFSPVEKCITGRVERPPKKRRNVRGIVEPRSSTCPFPPPPKKKNETSGRFEGARG